MIQYIYWRKPLLCIAFLMTFSFSINAQKKVISITTVEYINASKKDVFNMIKQLERYPEWSPFLITDPKQKHNVTGENGEIGSTFHWEGVTEKSKGHQTLDSLNTNKYLRMSCEIEKPFKGSPVFEYKIVETENGVKLIQDFNLRLSRFSNFMTKLFGVKKKMIASNKLGLKRLKELIEKETN